MSFIKVFLRYLLLFQENNQQAKDNNNGDTKSDGDELEQCQ